MCDLPGARTAFDADAQHPALTAAPAKTSRQAFTRGIQLSLTEIGV